MDGTFHLAFSGGLVYEVIDYGNWGIGVRFLLDFFAVNHNLGMEYLLLYAFIEVVGLRHRQTFLVSIVEILLGGIKAVHLGVEKNDSHPDG